MIADVDHNLLMINQVTESFHSDENFNYLKIINKI